MVTVLGLRQRKRRTRWRMGRWLSLGAVLLALALAPPAVALAHEHRTVHGYELIVGFNVEPAYVGQINGAFLQVMQPAAPDTEGQDDKESDGGHAHAAMMPVEGLEATLTVLVAAGGSEPREFPLRAVYGAPGTYVADFVPTRTGSYIFTFTGTIGRKPDQRALRVRPRALRRRAGDHDHSVPGAAAIEHRVAAGTGGGQGGHRHGASTRFWRPWCRGHCRPCRGHGHADGQSPALELASPLAPLPNWGRYGPRRRGAVRCARPPAQRGDHRGSQRPDRPGESYASPLALCR